jgi:predicted transcriptional regulator
MVDMAEKVNGKSGPVPVRGAVPPPADWRQSITRYAVACLECGATFPRLSVRHLRTHGLDAHAYRVRYGIPRTQPLSAHAIMARRKQQQLA